MHAARLAKALQTRTGAHILRMGGPRMREAGVEIIADAKEIAVLGIAEVIHKVPTALKKILAACAKKPQAADRLWRSSSIPPARICRLAKKLHRLNISVVYFIAPQVWAWRPWRIHATNHLQSCLADVRTRISYRILSDYENCRRLRIEKFHPMRGSHASVAILPLKKT